MATSNPVPISAAKPAVSQSGRRSGTSASICPHARAIRILSGTVAGKKYAGSFDWEIVKKTKITAAHASEYRTGLLISYRSSFHLLTLFHPAKTRKRLQGRRPPRNTGR